MTNARDSDTWLRDLRGQGVEHEAALADLRMRLLEDLPRGLSKWLPPEHPDFEFIIEYTVQVSLARVLNKLGTYEGQSQLINWVYKIAVRIALNEWRRLRWRDIPLGVAENEASNDRASNRFEVSNRSPVFVANLGDLRQRIQPILVRELSTRERMVIFAIYFQGMPIKEVARRMDTDRSAVYQLLHGARLRLRQRLAREALAPGELLKALDRRDDSDSPSTSDQVPGSVLDWLRRRSKGRYQPDAAIRRFLRDLEMTEENEISCEEVYEVVDQFVEAEQGGQSDLLFVPHVRQHLDMCPDCREEYEALLEALRIERQLQG